jgi:hypothetical protein
LNSFRYQPVPALHAFSITSKLEDGAKYMNKSILPGLWRHFLHIPHLIGQGGAAHNAEKGHAQIGFMGVDHHKVRDFVVLELPRRGRPIPADDIAKEVNLPLQRTQEILDELEKGMTFLFRNEKGEVAWAYPVTAESTPHRIHFSSGEQIYAA